MSIHNPGGGLGLFLTASRSSGSMTVLTSVTAANITSLLLPAGNWIMWGTWGLGQPSTSGGQTTFSWGVGVFSLTSASLVPINANSATTFQFGGPGAALPMLQGIGQGDLPVGPVKLSLTVPTTVYLNTECQFTAPGGSSAGAFGMIAAQQFL